MEPSKKLLYLTKISLACLFFLEGLHLLEWNHQVYGWSCIITGISFAIFTFYNFIKTIYLNKE